ncbi:MAG: 16S rRNA (adenine(1518)-N(6)/adenine(1519)-N(6))-dimethyltransferase RsmA [Oscillospiraceae bacterium]
MDLCNINEINLLLSRHGFKFSKALGQNFLVASWVPERIVLESGINRNNGVLEIGPGVGCLTEKLSLSAGKVVSVELDERLLPVLGETVGHLENVEIVNGDIMKTDIPALVYERFSSLTPAVCANLPYNITSPVLTRLIDTGLFSTITVMIQREVARRICAAPGTADYGAFTVYTNFYTRPRLLFDVPPACFEPSPKVTSSVIIMERRAEPPAEVNQVLFFKIVRAAFNQRRKTLLNALASAFSPGIDKQLISDAITDSGLDIRVRGEALDIPAFAELTNKIERYVK